MWYYIIVKKLYLKLLFSEFHIPLTAYYKRFYNNRILKDHNWENAVLYIYKDIYNFKISFVSKNVFSKTSLIVFHFQISCFWPLIRIYFSKWPRL